MCASFFQLAIGSWNMYVEQAWQHADFNLETSDKFFFVLKKETRSPDSPLRRDSHADSACVAIPLHSMHSAIFFGCLFVSSLHICLWSLFSVRYFTVVHDLCLACTGSST